MVAFLVGIVFVAFAIYTVLPFSWSPQWWPMVVDFLKGGIPIVSLMIGFLALLIGIADIKDRAEARKEEEKEKAEKAEEAKRD